jgi:hypothetical protein
MPTNPSGVSYAGIAIGVIFLLLVVGLSRS